MRWIDAVDTEPVDLDIVVTNYRTPDLLRRHIHAYERHRSELYETRLTIIDVDPITPLEVSGHNYVVVDHNCGYAKACNLGAWLTSGRLLAFMNADARLSDNRCVDRCIEFLDKHPEVAVVGPLQVDSTGMVTHGGIFGTLEKPVERGFKARRTKGLLDDQQAVTVSGSAYFTKRDVWDSMTNCATYRKLHPDAGGAFLPTPHFFEETAYSYHVQAHGYEVWYLGSAQMIHEWHKSSRVGSLGRKYAESRQMFNEFCDEHGIPRKR